jgi:hypothetical protein
VVLKAVKDLILTTKLLIEKKEVREQTILEQEVAEQLREAGDGMSPQEQPIAPSRRMSESRLNTSGSQLFPATSTPHSQTERAERKGSRSSTSMVDGKLSSGVIGTIPKGRHTDDKSVYGSKKPTRKFFGESVGDKSAADRPENWYMLPSYSSEDMIMNAESEEKVKAGTFEALIERLTAHDSFGMYLSSLTYSQMRILQLHSCLRFDFLRNRSNSSRGSLIVSQSRNPKASKSLNWRNGRTKRSDRFNCASLKPSRNGLKNSGTQKKTRRLLRKSNGLRAINLL